jgi:hypothetical protein
MDGGINLTYCVAWKKNNRAFMISDSAISSFQPISPNEHNSFGEIEGLYDTYYVKESTLKIIKICDYMAICYSGNKESADEAIGYIKTMIEFFSISEILNNLKSTYGYGEKQFELIILYYENENSIYYFDGADYRIVDDFIDIGSGKNISNLSNTLQNFVSAPDNELPILPKFHLASVITFLQCSSIKNKFYNHGVGGVFFGILLDGKLNWCEDIHYYIYNESPIQFNYISVISRYDGVYSSSSFNGKIKYFYNQGTNENINRDLYIQKSIRKSLNTRIPEYLVFYSNIYNMIYIMNIQSWGHNSRFKMWIRRNDDETQVAFVFDPFHQLTLVSYENNSMYPEFCDVAFSNEQFIRREDFIASHLNPKDFNDLDEFFDLDLRAFELNLKYEQFNFIDAKVSNYKNIIILDYNYFCDVVQEKYELYKLSGVKIEMLNFAVLIEQFLPQIASSCFKDYGLFVMKNISDNRVIDGFAMNNWFQSYPNCTLIHYEDNSYKKELPLVVFETLKNYYFNDSYFHVDKVIIGCDDEKVNDILSFAPRCNFDMISPDILLIRNFNSLTNMDGRFRYIVIDYAVSHMFNLNIDQIGLLESGFVINIDS